MPDTRIYAVTDADETALIRAASKAQAIRHFVAARVTAEVATQDQLVEYMSAAQALLFLRGRIYFERGSRPGANRNGQTTTPPFGIVICAYGARMAKALLRSELLGVRATVYERSTSRST